ncbi:MAG TPA: type II secretion system F family protein, partial [Bacilli bacterium]
MPQFRYDAVYANGKKVSGTLRASSKQQAINELVGKGLAVRSVAEKKTGVLDNEIIIGRAVKLDDFVIFCRQFATLIKAGIQIDQGLDIMEEQTTAKRLKAAIGDVADQVRSGHQLSQAMVAHPRIFPEMFVNMVQSGETGGNLDDVLERMADHYEKEHKTIQKIKSAMTYPIIVLILAIAVVIFLLIKIVPTFAGMFQEQGAELPFITRLVMGASGAVVQYWWMFLLAAGGAVAVVRMILQNEEGKLALDRLKLRLPVFGPIIKKAAIARMARTMASLFSGGVQVLQALDIAKKVVGNRVIVRVLGDAKSGLERGKLLSEPLRQSGLFPKMVISMLVVGEETGQLDKMLAK